MEYKISKRCCNYSTREKCLKCGKCGRRFRKGILVDDTNREWRQHIDDAIAAEQKAERNKR